MFVVIGLILGAITGATIARRRKGRTADIVQYALVYAIAFGLVGMIVTIIVHRSAI